MRRFLAAVLTLAFAACHDAPTAVSDGTVTAQRLDVVLSVENTSSQPVHFLAIERETAALVNWIACAGPSCPSIGGDSERLLPLAQVTGYSENSREALLYWWRAVSDGNGGLTHDSIRVLIVPL